MWRYASVLLVACVLSGALLADVARRGTEFQVNTYTTGSQSGASVASDAAGSFVVVWTSVGQDGSDTGIFGRRFDSAGPPLGPEFQVNAYTTSYQDFPSVASDAHGNFVVVWQSWWGQDGSESGIFGRRFDSTGAPSGPDFLVNTYTTSYQESPSVASDPDGNFLVVWRSLGQDGSGWGGFGRAFDRTGAPTGPEFQINTFTTGAQDLFSVASDAVGNFAVVWQSLDQDGSSWGVFGRRFDSTGAPLGPEFQVNTDTASYQERPAVASDAGGNFVVAWQSWDQDGSYWGVFGRRFDSAGAPTGPEFQVNAHSANHQDSPSVASDAAGEFVVTWASNFQDGSDGGVFGRRFDSAGAPTGPEFQVNTYTPGNQASPSVASDEYGSFVVTWSSGQDGWGPGVFGHRFLGRCPTLTSPLDGDPVDCSDPRFNRPTLSWDDDGYDRFRVFIAWDPGFGAGTYVTSGDTLLRTTDWTPSAKKWRKACANALAVNPGSPTLYLKVLGVDRSLPKGYPARKLYSETAQVHVQP